MDKKTKNILIISGVILALGVASYFIFKKPKPEDNNGDTDEGDSNGGGVSTNLTQNASFPLKVGSKGKQVAALQRFLNDSGESLSVDGVFGNKTKTAVSKNTMFLSNVYPDMKLGEITQKFYNDNVISYE